MRENNVIQLPQRKTHTSTDTILLTKEVVKQWRSPPFQRPIRVNDKVKALVEEIKANGGVLPGVITIGKLDKTEYMLDGQHRVYAWQLTELPEGFCDIRTLVCATMGEMGKEFVKLNSHLVNLRPDDILKGLEESNVHLRRIRQKCNYVGYDMIRRGEKSPLVSMSAVLRCWYGSSTDVPAAGGMASMQLAEQLTEEETDMLCRFLDIAYKGWGRDPEYFRLWANLNLTLNMWMYRRLVIVQYSPNTARLTNEQFLRCLMSESANPTYIDWLTGRNLSDRDRSPAYTRLKSIFAKRIEEETGKRPRLPQPAWEKGHV